MLSTSTVEFTMTGIAPLLMHSDRLADPIAPETIEHKKLTAKRLKSYEDHLNIARSEWMAGLLYEPDIGVYMSSQMIRASLVEGAKMFKLGKKITRAVMFTEHRGFALDYEGPKDPSKLWERREFTDKRSVKIGQARLMRYRPRFDAWSCSGSFILDTSQLSTGEILQCFETAGMYCGIGDYRISSPKGGIFGTYEVVLN